MHNKTLALFLNSQHVNKVTIVKNYLKDLYEDFVVFTNDNLILDKEHPILPSIYLKFFQGDVVFFSFDDLLEKNDILAKKKYLVCSLEEVLRSKIPTRDLKETTLLNIQNDTIERIDYAKL